MKSNSTLKAYWIFIIILQILILNYKIKNDGFYIWNFVALIGGVYFLYSRIKNLPKKLYYEEILTFLLITNSIFSSISYFISDSLLYFKVVGFICTIFSIYALIQQRKESKTQQTPPVD